MERPLPIANLQGGVLLEEPIGQILPEVLLALGLATQLSSTGRGAKCILFPEQTKELTSFLSKTDDDVPSRSQRVVFNIVLSLNFSTLSLLVQ